MVPFLPGGGLYIGYCRVPIGHLPDGPVTRGEGQEIFQMDYEANCPAKGVIHVQRSFGYFSHSNLPFYGKKIILQDKHDFLTSL